MNEPVASIWSPCTYSTVYSPAPGVVPSGRRRRKKICAPVTSGSLGLADQPLARGLAGSSLKSDLQVGRVGGWVKYALQTIGSSTPNVVLASVTWSWASAFVPKVMKPGPSTTGGT